MTSIRNAPDWFGGASNASDGKHHSTSGRSTSNGPSNSSHRRSKSSSDVFYRKKSKHRRTKSRDLIENSSEQQSQNQSKPAISSSMNQKNQNTVEMNGVPNLRSEDDASPDETQQNSTKESKKNPSILERIFGGIYSKTDKGSSSKSSKQGDRVGVEDYSCDIGPKLRSVDHDYDSEVSQLTNSHLPIPVSQTTSRDISQLSMSPLNEENQRTDINSAAVQPQTFMSRSDPSQVPPLKSSSPQVYSFPYSKKYRVMEGDAENDDFLTYSDDDASTHQLSPYRPSANGQNHSPYSSFRPYTQQNIRYPKDETSQILEQNKLMTLAPSYSLQKNSKRYGSISPFVKNEFYMSEDDTSTLFSESQSSRQTYDPQWGRIRVPNLPNVSIDEEDDETSALLSNDQSNGVRSKRNNMMSDDNRSLGGSSENTNGSMKFPSVKREPAPPISQVKIHNRNASVGTDTTVGTTPPDFMYGSVTSMPIHPGAHARLSRKELKKLMRKIDMLKEKEDVIASIIRQGHLDALNWSNHVPQVVGGKNRAAGFFPEEEKKMYDVPFLILFIFQLCVVSFFAITYVGETTMYHPNSTSSTVSTSGSYVSPVKGFHPLDEYNDDPFATSSQASMSPFIGLQNKDIRVDYSNAFRLSCITGLYSTALSALSIGMMMILGKALIPTVLCLSVMVCVALGTIGIALSPYSFVPVIGIIALAFTLGYSIVVWDRIPFAATNLNVALSGVKGSADVLLVALGMMLVSFMWTIDWLVAFLGIYDHYLDKLSHSNPHVSNILTWKGISIYSGMIISYFWTLNVIMVSIQMKEHAILDLQLISHRCHFRIEYYSCHYSRSRCDVVDFIEKLKALLQSCVNLQLLQSYHKLLWIYMPWKLSHPSSRDFERNLGSMF